MDDVRIMDTRDLLNTAALGFVVPLCLRIGANFERSAHGATVACVLLLGTDYAIETLFGLNFEPTYHFLRACGKIMLLTALGDYLTELSQLVCATRGHDTRHTTTYDCIATLLLGFMVFSQVVDAIQTIMGTQFDSATFLGLLLAGFTYAIRDSLSCLLAGLQEIISPRFAIDESVVIDGIRGTLHRKGLMSVQLRCDDGYTCHVPAKLLAQKTIRTEEPGHSRDAMATSESDLVPGRTARSKESDSGPTGQALVSMKSVLVSKETAPIVRPG